MANKLVLTIGISGSGKSTWAHEMSKEKGWVVVSRDKIRELLFGYTEDNVSEYYEAADFREREHKVSEFLFRNVKHLLDSGNTVIVDATHLKEKYLLQYAVLSYPIWHKVFDVDVDVAIQRDVNRRRKMGEDVIRKQWMQFKSLLGSTKLQTEEPRVFFASDTHYNHRNICRGTSSWKDKGGCRNYNTLAEMNDAIVDGINSKVGKHDILYHLGDVAFGGGLIDFLSRIKVRTIHLIRGNHDHQIPTFRFASVNDMLEIEIKGVPTILCHYPLAVWKGSHRGHFMLHGHCHGSFNNDGVRRMDVGVDAIDGKWVLSEDEAYEYLVGKGALLGVSHHNENTNIQ